MDPKTSHFASRKLHSLLGVLPLVAFILEHLFTNAFVLGGQHTYDKQVNWLLSLPKPILFTLEIVLIALPLLFHSVLGVKIAMEGRSNARDYPYARNIAYSLQRWSGMYLLVFIIYHVWTTRFSGTFEYPASVGAAVVREGGPLVGSKSSIYYFMLDQLSGNWLLAIVYLLGVAAAAFHASNGLFTFCITWGITVGKRAQQVSRFLFNGLGAALLVIGSASVFHLVLTKNPYAN